MVRKHFQRMSLEEIRKEMMRRYIFYNYPNIIGISQKEFCKRIPMPESNDFPLLVIPACMLTEERQLQLIGIKNTLELLNFRTNDLVKNLPRSPYWIYGVRIMGYSEVENGNPKERPLTLNEGISLYMNDRLFSNSSPDFAGCSRYMFSGTTYLYLFDNGHQERMEKLVLDIPDYFALPSLEMESEISIDPQRHLYDPGDVYCNI